MKLRQFRTRVKLQCPNISGVDDSEIDFLINKACDETNLEGKFYKTSTDFNIVADQMIYQLSTIAPTFLGMEKKPIYFKDSNNEWQEIHPRTKEWITKKYPNWLNAESVDLPQYYWQEGDELGLYPPPSTSKTSGGKIFHLKKRTDMGNDDHYPFSGSTTEITALLPADDAIVAYCRWKLSPAVGAVTDTDLREQEFLNECRRASIQIKRRPDIAISNENAMSI